MIFIHKNTLIINVNIVILEIRMSNKFMQFSKKLLKIFMKEFN